jgi:formylglycine-generating enzyme required for sulfatase activity
MSARWLCLFALASAGCTSGSWLTVLVQNLAADATRLTVRTQLDVRPAMREEAFSAPPGGFGADTSFVLSLAPRTQGRVGLAIFAWSGECVTGWQSSEVAIAEEVSRVEVALEPVSPPDCSGSFERTPGMVTVPAGSFLMGEPVRTVTLPAFEIDRTEVTRAAYAACVATDSCALPLKEQEPSPVAVTYVSWYHARAFCEHRGKRLPSEAEWEKAARGVAGALYPWGDDTVDCEHANYNGGCRKAGDRVAPVAGLPLGASPYGLFDMAGNADEWTEDAVGEERVLRGGSFYSDPKDLRTARRRLALADGSGTISPASLNTWTMGFRCARSLP